MVHKNQDHNQGKLRPAAKDMDEIPHNLPGSNPKWYKNYFKFESVHRYAVDSILGKHNGTVSLLHQE